MSLEDYKLVPLGSSWCELHWTVEDAHLNSWVFINGGELAFGPLVMNSTERVLQIPFSTSKILAIEIHNLPADEFAAPIFEMPHTRPILRWNPVSNAVRYRIYHKTDGATKTKIYDRSFETTETQCPIKLTGTGGQWHFLRVEAVDEYGNESTRASWLFYSCDLPASPTTVNITNGSSLGTFTFEIGV